MVSLTLRLGKGCMGLTVSDTILHSCINCQTWSLTDFMAPEGLLDLTGQAQVSQHNFALF